MKKVKRHQSSFVARMSVAKSGGDPLSRSPHVAYAHAGYLLFNRLRQLARLVGREPLFDTDGE
jgi:hypothetical protein